VDSGDANKICRACPAGTTSAAGALRTSTVGIAACTDSGSDTAVSTCLIHYHVASNVCVKCEAGKTNVAGDDPSGPDTSCDTPAADPPHATLCVANERVLNHACATCPVGTTNAAGDDPHYHDTECAATICAENYRVVCTDSTGEIAPDATTGLMPATRTPTSCTCVACNTPDNDGGRLHLTNTAGDDCSLMATTTCV
jgi:hypothetical protein